MNNRTVAVPSKSSLWKVASLFSATMVLVAGSLAQDPGTGRRKPGRPNNPPPSNGGSQGGGSQGGGSQGGGRPSGPPPSNQGGGNNQGGGSPSRDRDRNRGGGNVNGSPGNSSGGNIGQGNPQDPGQGRRGGQSNGGSRPIQNSDNTDRVTVRGNQGNRVRYGTISNSVNRSEPFNIGRAPVVVNGRIGGIVNRQEQVRVWGTVNNGVRFGYVHYNRNWRDDNFSFGYYVFNPWQNQNCAVSPWYSYASLPPYIAYNRICQPTWFAPTWVGYSYTWQSSPNNGWWNDQQDNTRQRDLDLALEDLRGAFEDSDSRALDRLIPRRGLVNVTQDDGAPYAMRTDDFYDMFQDSIESTRTRRYEIVDVRFNGRDGARVTARHEITDPWGRVQVIEHRFYLQRERRDYVIREFGTSQR